MNGDKCNVRALPETGLAPDCANITRLMRMIAARIDEGDIDATTVVVVVESSRGRTNHWTLGPAHNDHARVVGLLMCELLRDSLGGDADDYDQGKPA